MYPKKENKNKKKKQERRKKNIKGIEEIEEVERSRKSRRHEDTSSKSRRNHNMQIIDAYIFMGYQTTPRSSHPQVWAPYFFPYSFPYLFLRDSARLRLLNGQLEDYLNYLGLCVVLIQSLI